MATALRERSFVVRGWKTTITKANTMGPAWNLVRIVLVAVIVVAVAELSKRFPRAGALLLSLPLISILAVTASWFQHRDLSAISRLARETLIFVPLGLPFFVPLAFADHLGLSFWTAFAGGLFLASLAISAWLVLGPGIS